MMMCDYVVLLREMRDDEVPSLGLFTGMLYHTIGMVCTDYITRQRALLLATTQREPA